MHDGDDVYPIGPLAKKYSVWKAKHAALANIVIHDAKLIRIRFDARQRGADRSRETQSQAFLRLLVATRRVPKFRVG
jgi:hypothetical protein